MLTSRIDGESVIADTARLYRDVVVLASTIGEGCCVADCAEVRQSAMAAHSEVGRRSLVFNSSVGYGSYIGDNSVVRDAEIGKYCSISWNLSIGGANHDYSAASMYSDYWWKRVFGIDPGRERRMNRTVIGNDVWIGAGSNILAGVEIGDGAVIGASALVAKDVPPYAIMGGGTG